MYSSIMVSHWTAVKREVRDMHAGEIRNVAVIGLGRMGAGIASNLLKAGFPVTVYNRTASKMQLLIDAGAAGAVSPRQAVVAADVVRQGGSSLYGSEPATNWSATYEITRMNAGLK
jgi:glutamyl-tRNA reductase